MVADRWETNVSSQNVMGSSWKKETEKEAEWVRCQTFSSKHNQWGPKLIIMANTMKSQASSGIFLQQTAHCRLGQETKGYSFHACQRLVLWANEAILSLLP